MKIYCATQVLNIKGHSRIYKWSFIRIRNIRFYLVRLNYLFSKYTHFLLKIKTAYFNNCLIVMENLQPKLYDNLFNAHPLNSQFLTNCYKLTLTYFCWIVWKTRKSSGLNYLLSPSSLSLHFGWRPVEMRHTWYFPGCF